MKYKPYRKDVYHQTSVKLHGKKSTKLSNYCIISLSGIDQCRNQQVSALSMYSREFCFFNKDFRMS